MIYQIRGCYRGRKETVDTAETLKEARRLLAEYRLAFGADWRLRLRRARNVEV